jgi:hypothetical protein
MKKLLLLLLLIPMVSFGQEFKVIRVIDGDTFVIEGGELKGGGKQILIDNKWVVFTSWSPM